MEIKMPLFVITSEACREGPVIRRAENVVVGLAEMFDGVVTIVTMGAILSSVGRRADSWRSSRVLARRNKARKQNKEFI